METLNKSSFIAIPRPRTRYHPPPVILHKETGDGHPKKKSDSPLTIAQNNAGHERLARYFREEALGLKGRQRRPMVVPRVSPVEEELAEAMDIIEKDDEDNLQPLLFVSDPKKSQ